MANKGKAMDKDRLRCRNKVTSNSFSGTRHHHDIDSVRTLDSRNVTPMQWMLIGTRREDCP